MFACGVATWAILIPLNALVQVPGPESLGLRPDGAATPLPEPGARALERVPIWRALRTPAFWLLFLSVTMVGLVAMTLAVHQPRLVVDLGFSLNLSALLFGTLGLMRTFGGMIWGPLSDRIGRTPCIWIITAISVLGFLALLSVVRVPAEWPGARLALLWAFTVTFGIGYNGLTPLYASAVAERFAGPSLGTMFGLLDLGFGAGAAAGPWLAGRVYDLVSSYTPVLWAGIVAMVVSGVALSYVGEHRAAHHAP
jgi:MFS family permease